MTEFSDSIEVRGRHAGHARHPLQFFARGDRRQQRVVGVDAHRDTEVEPSRQGVGLDRRGDPHMPVGGRTGLDGDATLQNEIDHGGIIQQRRAVTHALSVEYLDGRTNLRGGAAFSGVHRTTDAQIPRALESTGVVLQTEDVTRSRTSCEIDADHSGTGRSARHVALQHVRGFTVKTTENQPRASVDALQGGVHDGFDGSRTGMKLRGETDLQGGDPVGDGVFADLGGDPANGAGRLQQGQCELEAREGRREPHPREETQFFRDHYAERGSELHHSGGPQGAVEMSMKVDEVIHEAAMSTESFSLYRIDIDLNIKRGSIRADLLADFRAIDSHPSKNRLERINVAKKSKIAKNQQRKQKVAKYASRRNELKAVIKNKSSSPEDIQSALFALQALPRDSSPVRLRNRCVMTGRTRGYYRKFQLSRIALRELALRGQLPGVTKSSW